ncbi:MAG TPA: potassium ABC transporter ATPase [Paraburkholderia sp.]|nr:potassium ABC transporter ATPase [Paraburkholderia sp.]
MDVVYVGGIVLFAALTFALISGCEKLIQFRRGHGARS